MSVSMEKNNKKDFVIYDLEKEDFPKNDTTENKKNNNLNEQEVYWEEEPFIGYTEEDTTKKVTRKGKFKIGNIIVVFGVLIALIGAVILIKNRTEQNKLQKQMEVLREQAELDAELQKKQEEQQQEESIPAISNNDENVDSQVLPEEEDEVSYIPNPYASAFQQNDHMAAWIKIDDTKIDYPVMQTMEDENYYLKRGFDGKSNQNGCLILDTDSTITPSVGTNLIIHGHNMKSGEMFAGLNKYEDKEYAEEHKYIKLYTKECERNYEVIAVFRTQVYKKSDNVFKFYKFFQADTQEEFNDWYDNIKKLSMYDTGVTAEFGDRFLTLSTCVYHVEHGRLVVVGKEIEPGDYYEPIE